MRATRLASSASDKAVLDLCLLDASNAQAESSRLAAQLRKDLGLRRPAGRRF